MASEVVSYMFPAIDPTLRANQVNWRKETPSNGGGGSLFRSDQNESIIINIASTSEYIKSVQSFVTGTIVPRDASGAPLVDASTRNSYQGITRAISAVTIRIGGTIVDHIPVYNDVCASVYALKPLSHKRLLSRFEGYGNTQLFTNGGYTFCHQLQSSLFVTEQLLPLPFTQVGISIELHITGQELFTSPNVAYYTFENVAFKFLACTPDPRFTAGMSMAIHQKGRSAYIPYQQIRTARSNGNGSDEQLIQVPIGNKSSITSLEVLFWDQTAYANAANDKALRFIDAGVVSWTVTGAGITNPRTGEFQHNGGANPEAVFTGLLTETGNGYIAGDLIDIPDNFENNSFRLSMNFQAAPAFRTGLDTTGAASQSLTITTKHKTPLPANIVILVVVVYDSVIEISSNGVRSLDQMPDST